MERNWSDFGPERRNKRNDIRLLLSKSITPEIETILSETVSKFGNCPRMSDGNQLFKGIPAEMKQSVSTLKSVVEILDGSLYSQFTNHFKANQKDMMNIDMPCKPRFLFGSGN
jgi:hypothetical protein